MGVKEGASGTKTEIFYTWEGWWVRNVCICLASIRINELLQSQGRGMPLRPALGIWVRLRVLSWVLPVGPGVLKTCWAQPAPYPASSEERWDAKCKPVCSL